MKIALQRCCTTPIFLRQYEISTDSVLRELDVELVEKELNCCGYPLKNVNFKAHALASSRNLALAERRNLDLMTLCNCCYGALKHINHIMRNGNPLQGDIKEALNKERLKYDGHVEVKHLMEVLHHDVGLQRIREKIKQKFRGLNIAIHYGCHVLRPRQLAQFASSGTTEVFDQLVELTGARIVPWKAQLECCGSPMWGIDDELSMDLTEKKIRDALMAGADYLCVACSYCQIQFDRVQKEMLLVKRLERALPSILYTQLLGICLGIDQDALGIDQNLVDLTGITSFTAPLNAGRPDPALPLHR